MKDKYYVISPEIQKAFVEQNATIPDDLKNAVDSFKITSELLDRIKSWATFMPIGEYQVVLHKRTNKNYYVEVESKEGEYVCTTARYHLETDEGAFYKSDYAAEYIALVSPVVVLSLIKKIEQLETEICTLLNNQTHML